MIDRFKQPVCIGHEFTRAESTITLCHPERSARLGFPTRRTYESDGAAVEGLRFAANHGFQHVYNVYCLEESFL